MALLDNVFKQRMVGALVLIALAVIFLPMLFSREDELRQVRVDAPQAPQAPVVPEVQVQNVPVPEPQPLTSEAQAQAQQDEDEAPPAAAEAPAKAAPSLPIKAIPAAPSAVASKPAAAKPAPAPPVVAAAKPDTAPKIDPNGLPISWSIQLASLATRASAEGLQKTLRSQGYNGYVRSSDGKNRVFVGPLIDRAEAERVRDVINRQQNIKGIVVRFEPEKS